ncbi:ATP-binding protein [Dyadobacter chenwenxiniae]|uniref:histidine kinase n=1 Tax=Dyadobacter chenwenxiniae TaxID=2906456 RepID=A0A9X1TGL8_9BACT|nr:ATP-binding protein [Dyadobacter chenwenxiniae]MCF0050969.1 ATP-binding protein [Dyadobacter chenwenxiniae]MCF0064257.1 ATP-binding protein [Dyadobacter chenwenxiniae]UON82530.1 ATP-binding protein [Dyadobacter chenwenxiniae]
MPELTDVNYHRLLKRQIRKSLPPELAEHPDLQDFLLSVNQAYIEYQDDLGRVELILEQSSGELFKANRELSRIAAEKTEEAALTNKRLEEVVSSITEVLMQLDQSGNIIYMNKAWETITGYPVNECINRNWRDFFADSEEEISEMLNSEHPTINATIKIFTSQRKEIWIGVSLTRQYHENVLAGYIGTFSDVTERVSAEKKLKSYMRDLERINAELDQFAYVVSHDLKAPLRAINNLSEWIEEDISHLLEGETLDQFKLLRGRVHRMESLINGILSYSRAGRIKTVKECFGINSLLDDMHETFSSKKPVRFVFDGNRAMELETEKITLTQILQNLISNGIKYNDKPEIEITIGWTEEESQYTFYVRDNGPGISPEFHDRIFVIFQTLQARDEIESTGVGLAIVKKILDEKGGLIRIESTMKEGTKFIFTWPKSETKESEISF